MLILINERKYMRTQLERMRYGKASGRWGFGPSYRFSDRIVVKSGDNLN